MINHAFDLTCCQIRHDSCHVPSILQPGFQAIHVKGENSVQEPCLCRFDPSLEKVLRNRRRTGRHMPYMNVIPPGLDFSNLKVDLPEDPVIKEMQQHKPAYGGTTPKAQAQDSPRSGGGKTPKSMSESSE